VYVLDGEEGFDVGESCRVWRDVVNEGMTRGGCVTFEGLGRRSRVERGE